MERRTSASGNLEITATSVFCVVNDDEPRGWMTEDLVDSVKDVAEGERLVGPVLSVHFDATESVEYMVST